MHIYDYLIVGAGLFGSVFARELTDAGFKCLIIDKRPHTGGNVYTEKREGIDVHMYGPHIFHTSDDRIWAYVNRFTKFNHYVNRPKVYYKGKIYSFPINLFTLYQLYGVKTPAEAQKKLEEVKVPIKNPKNLEEWVLSQVGQEIYEIFIKGYTMKQWMCDPKELPTFIIRRLPIRLTFDDNYFNDCYQGIPVEGYTKMMERLQAGIEVRLNTDYFANKEYFDGTARKVVFTGKIDEFFGYRFGELEYRTLRFEHEMHKGDYQGNAIINYTEYEIPYTRICEHKHFTFGQQEHTIITKEYPEAWSRGKEPYYPINNERNNKIYKQYATLSEELKDKYIFGGRLAEYKYYDMHQVIGSALAKAKKEIEFQKSTCS
ncbi:UDP-galactopyranose mutase [Thermonema lapsum]|uniref:UDP-galactopyranose mutase n=1 Tax=Thermonema lapsum TaxID=28195 RepID=A0A846MTM9_9BACT|nr:UDP-galactopyranose mutase [Thermonema lapsum]NIK74660.1 UDP-galactopyranose mutase [Thermonema lapsum]